MIQVKLLKTTNIGKANSVVVVSRNVAHGLIERGEGKIYRPRRFYRNKMIISKKNTK